jgi:hypothetical protein
MRKKMANSHARCTAVKRSPDKQIELCEPLSSSHAGGAVLLRDLEHASMLEDLMKLPFQVSHTILLVLYVMVVMKFCSVPYGFPFFRLHFTYPCFPLARPTGQLSSLQT